jgi:hypothetical protein
LLSGSSPSVRRTQQEEGGGRYEPGIPIPELASSTYTLGTATGGEAGAIYKVCWAHDPSTIGDYKVELDNSGELIGPTVGDLLSCTLGLDCGVTVPGYRLADTNAIVALSSGTCGSTDAVVATQTWTTTVVSSVAADGATAEYGLGLPLEGLPGDNYKLCWSHAPAVTSDLTAYNVEIDATGDLFGANLQELACTMGLECIVTITGYGLADTNKLAATSGGCGAGATVDADTWDVIAPTTVASDGSEAVFNFGVPTVGSPGSFYYLCWGHNPGALGDLLVELDDSGELTGPELNEFRCILGLPCSLTLSGYELSSSSSIVVLSEGSCGGSDAVKAVWTGQVVTEVSLAASSPTPPPTPSTPSPTPKPGPGPSTTTTTSTNDPPPTPPPTEEATPDRRLDDGRRVLQQSELPPSEYVLGTATGGSPGAEYKICWAHDPTALGDYKVEIDPGAELVGPEAGDLLLCMLGLVCDVTVDGYDLASTNGIVALSEGSCGGSDAVVATNTWTFASPPSSVDGTTSSYTFGEVTEGVPGSFYKLCWGHDPGTVLAAYNVEIDSAGDLLGVDLQDLDCTMGLPCRVTLTGYGLSSSSKLAAVSEGGCGASAVVAEATWDMVGPETVADDGLEAVFFFGTPVEGTPGKTYQLCWGPDGNLADLVVTLDDDGELVGPVIDDFMCTMGKRCDLTLNGYELADTSSIVVISSGDCGDANAVVADWTGLVYTEISLADSANVGTLSIGSGYGLGYAMQRRLQSTEVLDDGAAVGTYVLGTAVTGTPQSSYKVCWAHNPASIADYKVEVDANAELVGPIDVELSCTMGRSCDIAVDGYGLQDTNRIVVISSGQCGDPNAVVATDTWNIASPQRRLLSATPPTSRRLQQVETPGGQQESTPGILSDGSADSTYTFGTPVVGLPGDNYKLCWSPEGGGMDDFNVEIDDIVELVGPNTLDAECTMGLPCDISVTGFALDDSSSLLVIPGGSACGSDAAAIARWDASDGTPAVNYLDWDSVTPETVADDDASASYDFGTPVEGSPGPIYKICWSHDSLAAADHLVELGVFTLNGPETASFTCYIGGQCSMTIDGYGFETTNSLVIVYGPYDQINGAGTSGAGCGDAYFDPVPPSSGVMPASLAQSPATDTFTAEQAEYQIGQAFGPVGDHYKLCWAPVPSKNIPAGLNEYKVTVNANFVLAYPVDDENVWEEETSGASSGSGGFLGKPKAPWYVIGTYHDEESGLDLVFGPPAGA